MKITTIKSLNHDQTDQLVSLYSNEFWCGARKREDVITMLRNTDILVGAVTEKNELVGFVRVLTDYVYKATIYDLIVHPKWRNKNIGKLLMDKITLHHDLKNVEHFDLNCLPEMYPFYRKWGFSQEVGKLGFMRKFNKS